MCHFDRSCKSQYMLGQALSLWGMPGIQEGSSYSDSLSPWAATVNGALLVYDGHEALTRNKLSLFCATEPLFVCLLAFCFYSIALLVLTAADPTASGFWDMPTVAEPSSIRVVILGLNFSVKTYNTLSVTLWKIGFWAICWVLQASMSNNQND